MTRFLRVGIILVLVVCASALVSVRGLPACAEDVFKQNEWDSTLDAPCLAAGSPRLVIHGTLASETDVDWIKVADSPSPTPVELMARGPARPQLFVVAPGLPPGPRTLETPPDSGAIALTATATARGARAGGSFFYRPFMRRYMRVAAGLVPPNPGTYVVVTGAAGGYMLAIGGRPGFSLASIASYPADVLRVWLGAHD